MRLRQVQSHGVLATWAVLVGRELRPLQIHTAVRVGGPEGPSRGFRDAFGKAAQEDGADGQVVVRVTLGNLRISRVLFSLAYNFSNLIGLFRVDEIFDGLIQPFHYSFYC